MPMNLSSLFFVFRQSMQIYLTTAGIRVYFLFDMIKKQNTHQIMFLVALPKPPIENESIIGW